MKLLIAYDGSDCAEAALDDLRRAGLPRAAEAQVLAVADVWLPPEAEGAAPDTPVPVAVKRARAQAAEGLGAARRLAARGAERVRAHFPDWEVHAEASADSPAWAVIKRAGEWPADLVVVGSHGHSTIYRAMLGSVSQKVVAEAPCSVRVARSPRGGDAARIVVGVDGSPDADAAVAAVAAREWPAGSAVRLVTALDPKLSTLMAEPGHGVAVWTDDTDEDEQAWVARMMDAAAAKLRAAGLTVEQVIKEGDPKQLLLAEAEGWGADGVFVGARGHGLLERLFIGSVSSAVAARAHCSVEIVRPPATASAEAAT